MQESLRTSWASSKVQANQGGQLDRACVSQEFLGAVGIAARLAVSTGTDGPYGTGVDVPADARRPTDNCLALRQSDLSLVEPLSRRRLRKSSEGVRPGLTYEDHPQVGGVHTVQIPTHSVIGNPIIEFK